MAAFCGRSNGVESSFHPLLPTGSQGLALYLLLSEVLFDPTVAGFGMSHPCLGGVARNGCLMSHNPLTYPDQLIPLSIGKCNAFLAVTSEFFDFPLRITPPHVTRQSQLPRCELLKHFNHKFANCSGARPDPFTSTNPQLNGYVWNGFFG